MIKNSYSGKFIAIEGLDGSGKATQAAALADFFRKETGAALVSEPSASLIGDLIRARLAGDWQASPECLQLLFASDRANHLHREIIPKLAAGVPVICDRYAFSSFAYGALGCDLDWLIDVGRNFIMPDMAIYIDVPVDVCIKRLDAERKTDDIFEKSEILGKVRKNYETVMDIFKNETKIEKIDGNRSQEAVFEDAKAAINKILK
ncbi:MAG: dTMP kinase [Minisyncoccales bacterium]